MDYRHLMHELQLSMDYRHPHLLPILGACVESSYMCLVFPLMSMGSLYDVMGNEVLRRTHLSEGRLRLQLEIDVASALEYLHSVSVIYGVVTVANILIRARDNRLEAVQCTRNQNCRWDKKFHKRHSCLPTVGPIRSHVM